MTALSTISDNPVATEKPVRVVIVGGGVAGIAAGVALQSAGVSVTLIEPRKSLGGRASSFIDPQSGQELDNCQHVVLGCCTNLLHLYDQLGCRDKIRFEKAILFRDEHGKRHALRATPLLPAPGHLSASFATFGILSISEKLAYSRAMMAMLRLGKSGRDQLDHLPFGEWLAQHRQPDALVRKMYEPVLIGALNEDCRLCSAKYAIQVFQDAMLAHSAGYTMAVPTVPLSQLYQGFQCDDLRLGTRVDELLLTDSRCTGVRLSDGAEIHADQVILATNHHAVQKWIPDHWALQDKRFGRLDHLHSVPILGAHLEFDRPVLPDPHAAFSAGPLQWVFRKDAAGAVLAGVISAAREWAGKNKDQSLREFEQQIKTTLPQAREARLLRGVIVVEKRATFAPLPGVDAIRPQQAAPPDGLQGITLAGDYTQTHWPATMEGAARSGYLAADAVLAALPAKPGAADRPSFVQPDLTPQWPARWLGLR